MASAFAEGWAETSADLDIEFGEAFTLLPQAAPLGPDGVRDPNARPVASTARPPVNFVGIFFDEGAMLHAHGRSMADSTTRAVAAARPMIDVGRSQFDQDPLKGDLVQRTAPAQIFEVTDFLVDDLDRAWVHLAERRGPPSTIR